MFNHKCITIFLGALIFAVPVTAMEQSNNAESKAQYLLRLAQENKGALALTAVGAAAAVGLCAYLRPRDYNTEEVAWFPSEHILDLEINNQTHGQCILKEIKNHDVQGFKVIFKKSATNSDDFKSLATKASAIAARNQNLTNNRIVVRAWYKDSNSGGKVDCIVEYPKSKRLMNLIGDTANWKLQ